MSERAELGEEQEDLRRAFEYLGVQIEYLSKRIQQLEEKVGDLTGSSGGEPDPDTVVECPECGGRGEVKRISHLAPIYSCRQPDGPPPGGFHFRWCPSCCGEKSLSVSKAQEVRRRIERGSSNQDANG